MSRKKPLFSFGRQNKPSRKNFSLPLRVEKTPEEEEKAMQRQCIAYHTTVVLEKSGSNHLMSLPDRNGTSPKREIEKMGSKEIAAHKKEDKIPENLTVSFL